MTHRPVITLERNNAGRLFIGVTEFNHAGQADRSYVLSIADQYTADRIMRRRFNDMIRLMGKNVTKG